jgi:hypothetical protein
VLACGVLALMGMQAEGKAMILARGENTCASQRSVYIATIKHSLQPRVVKKAAHFNIARAMHIYLQPAAGLLKKVDGRRSARFIFVQSLY